MISSGSFYHAIGEGCNVLINESEFGRVKNGQHSFVHLVDTSNLSEKKLQSMFVPKREVLEEVIACYGEDKVVNAWKVILSTV